LAEATDAVNTEIDSARIAAELDRHDVVDLQELVVGAAAVAAHRVLRFKRAAQCGGNRALR
jgi:ribosomal protein L12E/L44/L45/RPP1/RPP2